MTPAQHQQVFDELQALILKTISLINRFETEGVEHSMAEDYQQLQDILATARTKQRKHRQALLSGGQEKSL